MCLEPKKLIRIGKRAETNYNGKKGEEYALDIFTKCGYCEQCQNEKSNNWVIRNYHESKMHKNICFITLTYKYNPYFLIKGDLQKFIKRLRRNLEYHQNKKFRMFDAGEYGTLHHRPHFHIIIYGWKEKEENLTYIDINKKGNPIYKSSTIDKIWKWGLHSYQKFESHEIPYIALYQTPSDTTTKQYRATKENLNKMLNQLKEKPLNKIKTPLEYAHRKRLIKEATKLIKRAEKEKTEHIIVKEFNTWSKALGWEHFFEEYKKQKNYDWKEYIEDKEFFTPTPWIKKLANMGDKKAINKMLALQSELNSKLTEEQEQSKNAIMWAYNKIKKKLDHAKNKDNIIM